MPEDRTNRIGLHVERQSCRIQKPLCARQRRNRHSFGRLVLACCTGCNCGCTSTFVAEHATPPGMGGPHDCVLRGATKLGGLTSRPPRHAALPKPASLPLLRSEARPAPRPNEV